MNCIYDFMVTFISLNLFYPENSMMASISVMESNGRLATPTAILECFPFSPNISKNKSEAGLITFGC